MQAVGSLGEIPEWDTPGILFFGYTSDLFYGEKPRIEFGSTLELRRV